MKDKIVAELSSFFDNGISLNQETLDYLTSVTGLESVNDIDSMDSSEKDSFLELVLFPDNEIRLKIEEILGDSVLKADEIKYIKERIKRDFVLLINKGEKNTAEAYDNLFFKFVDRLNLANPFIKNLAEQFEVKHLVTLRNSRLISHSEVLEFLRDLNSKREKFIWFDDIFDLSVKVLTEYKSGDIKSLFVEKKLFYSAMIQKDMQFKELLKRYNIETLMMQGVTPVAVDVDDTFEKIKLINQINRIVFGYSNECDHEHFSGEDINITDEISDLLDIFRK